VEVLLVEGEKHISADEAHYKEACASSRCMNRVARIRTHER
jgi:hypothetical protein